MSSAADKVYRLLPRPQQKHFPTRLTTVRPLRRQQSSDARQQTTLTQLDFYSPNSSFVSLNDISDDDVVDSKPNKKRKTKHRFKKQNTLTQIVRGSGQICDDLVPVSDSEDEVVHETQRDGTRDQQMVSSSLGPVDSDDEIARSRISSAVKPSGQGWSDRDAAAIISTPKRPVKHEIPSSNTPQNTLASRQSRRTTRSPTTSPLKPRSINVPTSPIPGSNIDADDCRSKRNSGVAVSPIKFQKPAIPTLARRDTSPEQPVAMPPPPRRRLHRMESIIADSQYDDAEATLVLDENIQSTYIPGTMLPPAPSHAVEDQATAQTHTQFQQTCMDGMQATYDPVMSALDRDADRFLPSQMSLLMSPTRRRRPRSQALNEDRQDQCRPDLMETVDEGECQDNASNLPIDLTDSSQQPGSPVSSVASPQRPIIKHEPQIRTASDLLDLNAAQEQKHVPASQVEPDILSRIPQTHIPSSPPPRALLSSSQRTHMTTHSSYSLYTDDTSYLPPTSQIGAGGRAMAAAIHDEETEDDDDLNLNVARPEARRSVSGEKPGRRLKRAAEILPDSLLSFSLPPAPAWTSSPPIVAEEIEDERMLQEEGAMEGGWGSSPPTTGVDEDVKELVKVEGTGGPVRQAVAQVQGDYSLPPPSSDWRSNGRLR